MISGSWDKKGIIKMFSDFFSPVNKVYFCNHPFYELKLTLTLLTLQLSQTTTKQMVWFSFT